MAYILVVEDDSDSREALCAALLKAGYEAGCLPDGREALASILARTPDLIVLDLWMPVMDGTTLLEVLRSYLRLQSLPVIVLTGLPDSPHVDRARHLKVNSILVKGKASFDDILAAVKQELPRLPT